MSKTMRVWARRMAVVAFALALAGIGFYAPSMAYATENDGADVVEEAPEENTPLAVQSAIALDEEGEIVLVQQANPEAVAFVSTSGVQTSYQNIGAALSSWAAASGDARLTLLKDVEDTVPAPVSITSSGKKTLNLNGHTATLSAGENYVGSALIYAGEGKEEGEPTKPASVDLAIEDRTGAGALVCNNIETVIKVSGYNRGSQNDYSSSLDLRGGTIGGGTQNTVELFGNGIYDPNKYSAKFEMTDGTIRGCTVGAGEDYTGYGVRIYGRALFEMSGGTICENAKGGVYLKVFSYVTQGTVSAYPLFAMYDGAISDNGAEGVHMDKESTFTMYDGTISNNTTDGVSMGEDAIFRMYGGTIAQSGKKGVSMPHDSTLEMYGGTISTNADAGVAVSSVDTYVGGNATFTMSGGEITGNTLGVLVSENSHNIFQLEGSPKILGNGSGGTACNVKLEGTLDDSSEFSKRIQITGPLATPDGADGPQIGVTIPVNGTDVPFTTGYDAQNPQTDPATFFKYDSAVAKDPIGDTKNAYICWNQGENKAGTDHSAGSNGEASRLLHTHVWQPCYQYAINLDDNGKAQVSHQENLLTAACIMGLANQYAIKHGACPHVMTATLTLSAQSKAYDGSPVVATLTASEGWQAENPYEYDASKIEYFTKDGTPLSGAPKDVGDYVAQYKLDAGGSWTPYVPLTQYDHITTSFSITPRVDPPVPPVPPATNNDVTYAAHCQTYGWNAPSGSNGTTAGTVNEAKRLEALTIKLADESAGSIEYRSHVQGAGWESSWAKNGGESGTINQSKRVEAIQVRLTGERAKNNSVWYRVHSQTYGWLGWAKDGEPAGTVGMSKRTEAYQVLILPEGQKPEDYDANAPAFQAAATGNAHVQGTGWTGNKSAGTIGTTRKSKRLECLTLSVPTALTDIYSGGIAYQAHVQGKGWTDEVANGAQAGTIGKSKRLEAVKIHLTGELAEHLNVWYRVHSQTFGWSGWACDGNPAGTTGFGKRAEAVQIVILPQGAAAPGSTQNAIRAR